MLSINQLSQELSIGVDTLRIWERRYGFPQPDRNSRGHRCYPQSQLEELRTIKKLQNLGYRPQQIFGLTTTQRLKILSGPEHKTEPELEVYDELILNGSVTRIETKLRSYLSGYGLQNLISERLIPLTKILGKHWEAGKLSIAREHLISDILEKILKEQLTRPQTMKSQARIVFLTLCGERHKLGLLMSAALFHQQGIDCLLMQEELPLSEIPQLVFDTGSHATALSFSSHYSPRQARKDLATLRNNLATGIKIVAGGQAVSKPFHLPGIIFCTDACQIPTIALKYFGSKT